MQQWSKFATNNNVSNTIVEAHLGNVVLSSIRAWARGAATPADIFIQIFDIASAADATLGTTIPDWVAYILDGDNITAEDGLPGGGLKFENGLFIAATSQPTNAGVPVATVDVRLGII